MKKIGIIVMSLLFCAGVVSAASPTPKQATGSATTPPAKLNAIDDLKERLATKVAELRTSQKKAIAGTVKSVTVSTVTVETTTNEVKIELTDDIKVIQTIKGKRTTLSTGDLAKGDSVVVFGDYDSSLDLLKAKVIVIQSALPKFVSGVITKIDKEEYTVTIQSPDETSSVIDIEKYTVVYGYTKDAGMSKSGFTKLALGETIAVAGTPNAKIEKRMSALRIISIGNLTGATPTPTIESTPTASPSATVKPKPTVKP